MKRELWEESGAFCKNYKDIGETLILGYFRWLVKAGKPEFVGLTKVKYDLVSFLEDKREVFGGREYYIDSIDDIKTVIEKIKENDNISVPLFMNLLCLERYYNEKRDELAKFIGFQSANQRGNIFRINRCKYHKIRQRCKVDYKSRKNK